MLVSYFFNWLFWASSKQIPIFFCLFSDPLYRPGFFPPPVQHHYAKNLSALTNIPSLANGSYYNNPQHPLQQQQQQNNYYNNLNSLRLNNIGNNNNNNNINNGRGQRNNQQQRGRGSANQRGYQLKVGGVVVGSWVGGAPNRAINQQARINRAGMVRYPIGKAGRTSMSNRNNRATGGQSGSWSGARGNTRTFGANGAFGVTKAKSNRNRKNKKKSGGAQKNKVVKKEDDEQKVEENGSISEENENKSENDSVQILIKKEDEEESTEELQNGLVFC